MKPARSLVPPDVRGGPGRLHGSDIHVRCSRISRRGGARRRRHSRLCSQQAPSFTKWKKNHGKASIRIEVRRKSATGTAPFAAASREALRHFASAASAAVLASSNGRKPRYEIRFAEQFPPDFCRAILCRRKIEGYKFVETARSVWMACARRSPLAT